MAVAKRFLERSIDPIPVSNLGDVGVVGQDIDDRFNGKREGYFLSSRRHDEG